MRGVVALTENEISKFSNSGCAGGSVSVSISGNNLVIKTNNIPDHEWQEVNPNPDQCVCLKCSQVPENRDISL